MSSEEVVRNVKLREASSGDADGIHALAAELAGVVGDATPDFGEVRSRLRELLEEPRARVLVAENGGEIVGVVSLWIKPDLAHGDTVIEVPMLVVAESERRSGIGKLLLTGAQEIAAEHGASLIELVATTGNVTAREFYSSLGFVEADVVALEFIGDVEDPPEPENP